MALINKISAVAEAVRERSGYTGGMTLEEMATEIKAIPYPVVEEIEITENGTYSAPAGIDGYSSINVEVPIPEPAVVEEISITENGTYTPPEGVDGYNKVNVNISVDVGDIPESALNITGNGSYKFAYGGWDWFIEKYGNQITTSGITNATNMFYECGLEDIPFEINLTFRTTSSTYMFAYSKIKKAPQVNFKSSSAHKDWNSMFWHCEYLSEIPEWLIEALEEDYNLTTSNTMWQPWNSLFAFCTSLREIPDRVMASVCNPKASAYYHTMIYSKPYLNLRSLDRLVNIPCENLSLTSNQFDGFFSELNHVEDITFATQEDGSPYVVPWKSQTIDLSSSKHIGWYSVSYYAYTYNSGITQDKQVTDDATYAALKDDADWFTGDINYSRYNHDSAVNTINSLPDCSATGTNTIKFSGVAGQYTDGGAINTLTEEEIAVAAAKGWTVTLV